MEEREQNMSERESLALITSMINKARDAYYSTGLSCIMWGSVVAFCSLEKLAELQFDYKLPFDIYLVTIFAIIPQVFISINEKRERKVKTYEESRMDNIWFAFGIAMLLMIFVLNSIFSVWAPVHGEYQTLTGHRAAFRFSEFVAPLLLILYGLPTFLTGMVFKFHAMIFGGILCWVCCIITLYTNIKIDLILTAVSAVCAWLIPGIIIKREYRKMKRELKQSNV